MNKRLLEHFYQLGIVDQGQVRAAINHQQQTGGDIVDVFLQLQMMSERDASQGLASFYRYPLVDLNDQLPEDAALEVLDSNYARKNQILPLAIDRQGRKIQVAVFDPARSLDALDYIRRRSGWEPQPYVTERTALSQAINYYYFGELPGASGPSGSGATSLGEVSGAAVTPDSGASTLPPLVLTDEMTDFAQELRSGMMQLPPEPESRPVRRFGRGELTPPPQRLPGAFGGSGSGLQPIGFGDDARIGAPVEALDAQINDEAFEDLLQVVDSLQFKLNHLEERLDHERRLVQVMMDLLIDSGLATRDELLEKLREVGEEEEA
ncbi:MAG: hypothetical protein CMH57_08470 [Myxococcales bacterium]|nr:hypothetical protein [Myxococcales bacterium]